jgi:4-amino-4-deoxy-L-arabinose transferase-like glycosyltransferase
VRRCRPATTGVTSTKITTLLAIAIAVGAVAWLFLHFVYTTFPPLPWSAAATLGLFALAELTSAWNVRPRIHRRPGTKPVDPLVVARFVALAKASAYAAAVFGGVFAGYLLFVLPQVSEPIPRHDAIVSGGSLVAAVLFAAAALFLEYACRVPKPPPDREDAPRR